MKINDANVWCWNENNYEHWTEEGRVGRVGWGTLLYCAHQQEVIVNIFNNYNIPVLGPVSPCHPAIFTAHSGPLESLFANILLLMVGASYSTSTKSKLKYFVLLCHSSKNIYLKTFISQFKDTLFIQKEVEIFYLIKSHSSEKCCNNRCI